MKGKKKLLLLVLLLFAAIGVAGYGVYSYYFTEGSYTTPDNRELGRDSATDQNVIFFDGQKFDPQVPYDGDINNTTYTFVGKGADLRVDCSDIDYSQGYATCSSTTRVYNNGSSYIHVSVRNAEITGENSHDEPTFNWTTNCIAPGESADLTASGKVYYTISSDPEEVTEPVSSRGDVTASLQYDLYAAQADGEYCD